MRIISIQITAVLLAFLLISSVKPAAAIDTPEKVQTHKKLVFDSARTAVLIMDYQNDIIAMLPEKERLPLLEKAGAILKESRQSGLRVIYVVVRFRAGYPEINPKNKLFAGLKESGRFHEGTPGAEIHPMVAPKPGDIVVTKRRVGAFSTTDLETILRANNIDTLVLSGISSSGVVLSTVRWAADMDYNLFVVADACADLDKEVHGVLMEKVFPTQATIVTTEEFVKAIGKHAGIQE
ncbi:MAG TPA: cysteine hydrolase [Dissulfurispiraceae bacterium]|nr:cysteine hydrolase [Dissulfurispiraceae bacterium]